MKPIYASMYTLDCTKCLLPMNNFHNILLTSMQTFYLMSQNVANVYTLAHKKIIIYAARQYQTCFKDYIRALRDKVICHPRLSTLRINYATIK